MLKLVLCTDNPIFKISTDFGQKLSQWLELGFSARKVTFHVTHPVYGVSCFQLMAFPKSMCV